MNFIPRYHTWMRLAQMALFAVCMLALGGVAAAQPDVPQPFVPFLDMTPVPAVTAPRIDDSRQSEAPSVPTETWAVEVAPGTDADALAARLGYVNLGRIANFENIYLFRIPFTGLRMDQLEGRTVEALQAEAARMTSARGRAGGVGAAGGAGGRPVRAAARPPAADAPAARRSALQSAVASAQHRAVRRDGGRGRQGLSRLAARLHRRGAHHRHRR